MASEPGFVPDGDEGIDAQFDAVVGRMAKHAATLVPPDASEDELDRIAVAPTKWALKR